MPTPHELNQTIKLRVLNHLWCVPAFDTGSIHA